ncbi:TIGR02391 family protein [Streptomyces badius]
MYELASFAAMKAVEVAVREASGLDNSVVGVHLMRAAFQPHKNGKEGGPLADAEAEGGEQEAASALFAGAMGAYKNPPSHRTVKFDDLSPASWSNLTLTKSCMSCVLVVSRTISWGSRAVEGIQGRR